MAYDGSAPKEIAEKPAEKKVEKKENKNALNFQEKREFGTLEGDIERLQKKKASIEKQFLDVAIETDAIAAKSEELQESVEQLAQKEERWLELSMKLEE
jgi:ATP-binding cassette subfamily F protein uup